jgi:hypothetical protein
VEFEKFDLLACAVEKEILFFSSSLNKSFKRDFVRGYTFEGNPISMHYAKRIKRLFLATDNDKIYLWNIISESSQPINIINTLNSTLVMNMTVVSDKFLVYTRFKLKHKGDEEHSIMIYDLEANKEIEEYLNPLPKIGQSLAFNEDKELMAISYEEGISIWRINV